MNSVRQSLIDAIGRLSILSNELTHIAVHANRGVDDPAIAHESCKKILEIIHGMYIV